MKSVSPETYKAIKKACLDFSLNLDYFRHSTEISNDPYVFPRLALLASLAEDVGKHINE